jgi:hypothetical protein
VNRHARLVIAAATVALLLLACTIEEDLRIEFDGSGMYRVKLSIPKDLAGDFGELRKQVEKDGFVVADEGKTETERFIVLRKKFSDITSLNDDHSHFELTITKRNALRRDYRFRAAFQPVGFGAYQRHFAVSMPCRVTSASSGEIDGSHVQWNASRGGTIEINASGFCIPLSRNQRTFAIAIATLGIVLLVFARGRRQPTRKTACAQCKAHLASGTRFCRTCGTGTPAAQT